MAGNRKQKDEGYVSAAKNLSALKTEYSIDITPRFLHNIKTYISFKECHRALWKEKKAPEDGDT